MVTIIRARMDAWGPILVHICKLIWPFRRLCPHWRSLLCHDAESNPRVDLASSRRLGVRSILVAPLCYY